MLSEPSKRKPDWDEANSTWITLADGQRWAFPKPWVEIYATFADGKAMAPRPVLTVGPELDDLVQALGGCQDNGALLCGAATLGAHMLTRQYELADSELDVLFSFRGGDRDSWAWVDAVLAVATGEGGTRSFRAGGV